MSSIDWKDKTILDCKNTIIDLLREEIETVITENKIKLNKILTELVERLDLAGNGIGFDLANYISTKEDLLIFVDLVRKGIEKYYYRIPNLSQEIKDLLENFYEELVKISKSFPE